MQTLDIKTISTDDPLFPDEFRELPKPPDKIYATGNLDLLQPKKRIGIIGTRKMTPYGQEVTIDMTRKVAKSGVVVVSGLALGIDSLAHRTAIEMNRPTIAVLPSSLNAIYPPSHQGLANEILRKNGLLICEYETVVQPYPHYFIERNRLIAALSHLILVVEAGQKSGCFHTIEAALALNRKIAVVPGNINSPMSKGTNLLIRDSKPSDVYPVVSSSDLLPLLGIDESKLDALNNLSRAYLPEDENEAAILTALNGFPSLSPQQLFEQLNFDISVLNSHLTILEFKGLIEQMNNNWRLIK